MDKVKYYEIWSEGYVCTGESTPCMKHGEAPGNDFRHACRNFAMENLEFKKYYNEHDNSYWGCKLFDNRDDASRFNG